MEIFAAGAWRSIKRGEILIGGQWRRFTRAEAYVGGQWRTVARFVGPLSVSVPGSAYGSTSTNYVSAAYLTITATPTGGLPPYTYFWNGPAPTTPTSATCTFMVALPPGNETHVDVTVTVTDALGSTANATCDATFENTGA